MKARPAYFIIGSGSGTGKTTLANRIHRDLDSRGLPVRCFYEIEIQSSREFGAFQKLFYQGDPAMKEALCAAIEAFARREISVAEWTISESLFPFLRWLILGNCSRAVVEDYCRFLKEHFAHRSVTLVALRCARDIAVPRAVKDRGEDWFRQWNGRNRNYPLFKANPDLDLWKVFEQEMSYADLLDWPVLEIDTAQSPLDEITGTLLRDDDLPPVVTRERAVLEPASYSAVHAPHPLLAELEISDRRIKMMGTWLDLVPMQNGSLRVANSNSTIEINAYGATLRSIRFGRVRYELSA